MTLLQFKGDSVCTQKLQCKQQGKGCNRELMAPPGAEGQSVHIREQADRSPAIT